ncbi:MAG: undecaprenyl-phosphate galactose phosphotransferase WbaP [Treponema sp.]|jgi:Undecaprenyl-phosphate galactose phosphotransferase WbaP|nr:undecaprenyl-phosphate galactose phosphotransferase WbaP [Treponema sp.]
MTLTDFDIWYRSRYRRTSSALTTTAFIFSDIFAIMLTFAWGFFWVRIYGFFIDTPGIINAKSFVTYWPYIPVFILIFQIHKLYPGISMAPSEEMRRFFIGSLIAYGGIFLSRYIERGVWDSVNTAFLISGIFSTITLLTARSATHWFLHKTRLGGIPTVIYGSDNTGKLVAECLQRSIRTGYIPVLFLDDNPLGSDEILGIPVIHDFSAGPEVVKRYNIKMAIIAMPELDAQKLKHLQNTSVNAFRYNVLIPNFFNISSIWMSVRDFSGVLGIDTSNKLKFSFNLLIKRILDITLVVIGGLLILPFILLIALLIKITSPGPLFYKQKRLGKNGKHFNAYKFRSMAVDADEKLKKLLETNPELKTEWEKTHKLLNDPRITGIGKLLRRTSIDEFPQIINILKGEMSIVGPRPIVDEEIEKYGEDFLRVFSTTPGLTGMWQVSGRSDADYQDRVAYDIYYMQSWSVWLDLWIIFKTFGVVIFGKGAY